MMKTLIIAAFALLLFAAPVRAQQDISPLEAQLYLLNQTPATQNPQFLTWQQMFSMKILSSNRQLIGRVEDIKVDESGALVKLVSTVNQLNRGEQIVENDINQIAFHEPINAFEIPLVFAETPEVSPESLAAIAPAAGGGDILSLKAMKGAEVRSADGRWLGVVRDVVFDEQAQAVQALVLEDVPGARRYTEIAIPFDENVEPVSDYGTIQFRVKREAAQTIMEFARGRR